MTTEWNDCFLHDRDRMRHDDAVALLRARLDCVVGEETVALSCAEGRVLANDVRTPHAIPLHTNAAVDGYAYRHPSGEAPLPVTQTVRAGDLDPAPLAAGSVARIFTGAPMPPDADTVAMQEDCTLTDGRVQLPPLRQGANRRLAGEDAHAESVIVRAGTRLTAAHVAALASAGQDRVEVRRRLRLALFSNGDELVAPGGASLRVGQVYDANRPMLAALLQALPVTVTTDAHLADDAAGVRDVLRQAAATSDVIVTSGGASRGDEDHMGSALDALGKRHLWQLAVKPGRPMLFGQIDRAGAPPALFFGLPGNPVAAFVCFALYVRPALLRLAGATWHEPMRFAVAAGFELKSKKTDRREFLRGWLETGENGLPVAQRFGRDGSGLISSLTAATGLIELPEECASVSRGEAVRFLPFTGLLG